MEQQAWATGRHIRTCRCIGDAGKDYLRAVYEASVYDPDANGGTA